jgi:hypothetical protein
MSERRSELGDLRRQDDHPEEALIVAEIEVTRTEMSGTIDELAHRLSPQVIAEQARDQMREATVGRVERFIQDAGDTAQQTGNTMLGTIRENPVPAALAAIGIGWLAMRMRDSGGTDQRHESRSDGRQAYRGRRYGYGYGYGAGTGRYGVEDPYGTDFERNIGSESGGLTDDIGRRGQELGERAQQTARDLSEQAQGTLQDLQGQAQDQLEVVQQRFDRTFDQNPLALGALAVGIGAAVALAIPETEQERQLMGEHSEKLMSEVEGAASRALSDAEQSARQTGQEVHQESRS